MQAAYLVALIVGIHAYQLDHQQQRQTSSNERFFWPTSTTQMSYVLMPAVPNGFKIKQSFNHENENQAVKLEIPQIGYIEFIKGTLLTICTRLNSIESNQNRIHQEMDNNFEEFKTILQQSIQDSTQNIVSDRTSEYMRKITDFEHKLDTVKSQYNEKYRYLYNLILEISARLSNPFLEIPELHDY